MPKVSDYDLEHFEEELERPQKIKKHKKIALIAYGITESFYLPPFPGGCQ